MHGVMINSPMDHISSKIFNNLIKNYEIEKDASEGYIEITKMIKSETETNIFVDLWLFTDDVINSEIKNVLSSSDSDIFWDGETGISQYVNGFARIITY